MKNTPPKIDVVSQLGKIRKKGWIPSVRRGNTGVGATLEYELGIQENNKDEHDCVDIEKYRGRRFEVKGQRTRSKSRISLKTKAPDGGMNNQELLDKYGIPDTKGRNQRGLYSSLRSVYGKGKITKNMKISREEKILHIIYKNKKVSYYDLAKSGTKKFENLILARSESKLVVCNCGKKKLHDKYGRHEYFHYTEISIYLGLSPALFFKMLDTGEMILDLRLHKELDKKVVDETDDDKKHDHGTSYRTNYKNLDHLYAKKITL